MNQSKYMETNDKYTTTENHSRLDEPRSEISVAHETSVYIYKSLIYEYDTTENYVESSSTKSNISIAHEEASSTAIPNVLKSSELPSAGP